jgi:hypothetical protein
MCKSAQIRADSRSTHGPEVRSPRHLRSMAFRYSRNGPSLPPTAEAAAGADFQRSQTPAHKAWCSSHGYLLPPRRRRELA